MLKLTQMMAIIMVPTNNNKDGFITKDFGNYYEDENGDLALVMSLKNAKEYHHCIDVPIYIMKK